jgi:hypothetical protein
MTDHVIISSETWKIRLPGDWQERECSSNQNYFESADGTKGVYLSTWTFPNDPRPIREIFESFRSVELRTLHAMKGSTWESVDNWNSCNPNLSMLGEDFLDRQKCYRIIRQLIAQLPWLVRATFHDYDCSDYNASKQFFQPIIESLQIHNEQPG